MTKVRPGPLPSRPRWCSPIRLDPITGLLVEQRGPRTQLQSRTPAPESSPGPHDSASAWSAADGAALYGLDRWGEPYFGVSGRGHVMVQPRGETGRSP